MPIARLFACSLVFASVAYGDEVPSAKEKAARDFAFERTKLGSSYDDFVKRYPKAFKLEKQCDPRIDLMVYLVEAQSASAASYAFFEGRLYEIKGAVRGQDR
jgi:hypothetical protein